MSRRRLTQADSRPEADTALTALQERVAQEFLVDLDASAAYRRARGGQRMKGERQTAHKMLNLPQVRARVRALMSERSARTAITADRVLLELARLGFSDMRRFVTWDAAGLTLKNSGTLSDDDAACVAEVSERQTKRGRTVRFRLYDKTAALEKICRHLGMFKDRLHHSISLEQLVSESWHVRPEREAHTT